MSKEKGKTIGLFVDPEDYELYISLGLRQRKEALASAKQALLSAMGKPITLNSKKAARVCEDSQAAREDKTDVAAITHNDGQAARCVSTSDLGVQAGSAAVCATSEEMPEGQATNIDAKGFLNGGW